MNMIAAVKKFVNSNLAKPLNSLIDEVKTQVGAINANVNTINTNVSAINANTARGAVKSVQRGTLGAFTTSQTVQDTTITISNVTPAKCGVTISGGYASGSSAAQVTAPRVISLSAASLVINQGHYTVSNTTYFGQVSWQVVEYY